MASAVRCLTAADLIFRNSGRRVQGRHKQVSGEIRRGEFLVKLCYYQGELGFPINPDEKRGLPNKEQEKVSAAGIEKC